MKVAAYVRAAYLRPSLEVETEPTRNQDLNHFSTFLERHNVEEWFQGLSSNQHWRPIRAGGQLPRTDAITSAIRSRHQRSRALFISSIRGHSPCKKSLMAEFSSPDAAAREVSELCSMHVSLSLLRASSSERPHPGNTKRPIPNRRLATRKALQDGSLCQTCMNVVFHSKIGVCLIRPHVSVLALFAPCLC
mgnify:CR=1 FL=1